jgi:hypothetical protein
VTFSEQLDNAAYTKTNVSVTANTSVSPDGYTNADTILSTAASPQLVSPIVTFGAATSVSIFVKYVSQKFVQLFGAGAFGDFANFDIQNATLGTSGASTANAKIENYGNGWLRISATFSGFVGNTTARIGFTASSSAGWNSLDTAFSKSVLAYGFQAEVGAYATSYIPTLSASVTRVAETALKTSASSLIGASAGVVYFEGTIEGEAASTRRLISISDGTVSNYLNAYNPAGTRGLDFVSGVGGVVQCNIISSTSIFQYGQRFKMAFAYAQNDFAFYINGTQIGIDGSGNIPSGLDRIIFGRGDQSSVNFFEGNVSQTLLFKTRLTNAQLAELTA